MDQRQLIDHCQLGDIDSFEELYRLYRHKALGTAYLIGGSKHLAEDIVQEAFVICYYKIKELKNPDVFNIWFYRIIVRVGWRMAAKHKTHVSYENNEFDQSSSSNDRLSGSDYEDKSNDRLLVREAIRKLTPPLKTVVILYYFNELTIKEIAEILDCFQGTVKSRLHKARKLLKRELSISFKEEHNWGLNGEELKENGSTF